MNRIIKYYLYLLPFFSLLGILLSISRTAFQESYVEIFLLTGLLLDLLVVFQGRQYLANNTIRFLTVLLTISFLVGLLNGNEISRRYITDFTNPFLFFSKIFVFAAYWRYMNFGNYINYYTKVAFYGSIILLPITYFLFSQAGVSRLAIFPPMELPFAYFMQNGGMFLLVSFGVIILYGKRSQLFSAIVTFFIFVLIYQRRHLVKYLFIILVAAIGVSYMFSSYSDNLAIRRLVGTIENLTESGGGIEGLEAVSAGRDTEIDVVINEMSFFDYIIGKGFGSIYEVPTRDGEKIVSNVHFSPLSFIAKYGLTFTLFIYSFILLPLFRKRKYTKEYITAIGVVLFVFLESFFAYALFVTPIFPICFGFLLRYQNIKGTQLYFKDNGKE